MVNNRRICRRHERRIKASFDGKWCIRVIRRGHRVRLAHIELAVVVGVDVDADPAEPRFIGFDDAVAIDVHE